MIEAELTISTEIINSKIIKKLKPLFNLMDLFYSLQFQ